MYKYEIQIVMSWMFPDKILQMSAKEGRNVMHAFTL